MAKKQRQPEPSHCVFNEERTHRYTLTHSWRDPELPSYVPSKTIMWIGCNPSVANETQLDPTLRRVKSFSQAWGYDTFIMTNLYGLISTQPAALYVHADPIGADNDTHLLRSAERVDCVVAAWGCHGAHLGRAAAVVEMMKGRLSALVINKDGSPKHPLYVSAKTVLRSYPLVHGYNPLITPTPAIHGSSPT